MWVPSRLTNTRSFLAVRALRVFWSPSERAISSTIGTVRDLRDFGLPARLAL